MASYTHIYTGNGKGKTTAALGLALRALGAGMKVYFTQFLKKGEWSEIHALRHFGAQITLCQSGTGGFIRGEPTAEDRQAAAKGFEDAQKAILSETYQLVVLDEIAAALKHGLVNPHVLLNLIRDKPDSVELVLTGRNFPEKILEAADLISEIDAVKHYFEKNVKARKGIEL